MKILFSLLTLFLITCNQLHYVISYSIDNYNSIEGQDTSYAVINNVKAFTNTLLAANQSTIDKIVHIPKGNVYYMGELWFENIYNVTIQIDGNIIFSDNFFIWGNNSESMICFEHSNGITINGKGVIDGQGLKW